MTNLAFSADHERTIHNHRTLNWFSTGAASAVMSKLEPGLIVNCDMRGSEDADNERFLIDCERWFGRPVERIASVEYANIDEVFTKRKYLSGIAGAPCTREMKFVPRLNYQLPSDMHLFGYTADALDVKRADNFRAAYPDMNMRFPLIERGLTKASCFAILEDAGIERPRVYDMGYPNGNCPGCVKSTSPDYWSLVRARHPEVFARRAAQSRDIGAKLVIVRREKDADGKAVNVRAFIDEIPADQPTLNPIVPSCDFMCHFAKQDIAA